MLEELKELLKNKSMESVSLVLSHVFQLIKWYEQNGDASQKNKFIDCLICILNNEKNQG